MTLILDLPPDLEQRLTLEAERKGMTAANYAMDLLKHQLLLTDEEFKKAATHILEKNAELYRRLA